MERKWLKVYILVIDSWCTLFVHFWRPKQILQTKLMLHIFVFKILTACGMNEFTKIHRLFWTHDMKCIFIQSSSNMYWDSIISNRQKCSDCKFSVASRKYDTTISLYHVFIGFILLIIYPHMFMHDDLNFLLYNRQQCVHKNIFLICLKRSTQVSKLGINSKKSQKLGI